MAPLAWRQRFFHEVLERRVSHPERLEHIIHVNEYARLYLSVVFAPRLHIAASPLLRCPALLLVHCPPQRAIVVAILVIMQPLPTILPNRIGSVFAPLVVYCCAAHFLPSSKIACN